MKKCSEMNIAEEAKIVPGAWKAIKKQQAVRCAADSKYKNDYERKAERLAEQQMRSLARTFAKGGKSFVTFVKSPDLPQRKMRCARRMRCRLRFSTPVRKADSNRVKSPRGWAFPNPMSRASNIKLTP